MRMRRNARKDEAEDMREVYLERDLESMEDEGPCLGRVDFSDEGMDGSSWSMRVSSSELIWWWIDRGSVILRRCICYRPQNAKEGDCTHEGVV